MTGDPDRTLVLHCVPFGVATTVPHETSDETIRERFGGPHVFAGVDPDHVQVLSRHLPRRVGRVVKLTTTDRHLVAHVHITDGSTWTQYRSGGLQGVSIGFEPIVDHWMTDRTDGRPVLERIKVRLGEISLVDAPAYPDAKVVGTVTDVERARVRSRLAVNSALRSVGMDPIPWPAPTSSARSSAPAAASRRPASTSSRDRIHYHGGGRVLAVR